MPQESDHNSPSERVLSAIDSLRTAYYGVETDNPWRADSAKELLESLTTGLDEEDIKSMEGTVNAVLKTRPTTITEKITTRATKDSNDKSEPAKSSLKPSSPTPVEYPSLHDLYNQFQQFKKKMGLDGKTEEEISEDAKKLQGKIDNLTIRIAELKQNKTEDNNDDAKLKKLTLDREQLLIQKKTLNFIVKNPNGMNPVMHLFLDAGQIQTQKQLEDWDRKQLPSMFKKIDKRIISFIIALLCLNSTFRNTRKKEKRRLMTSTITNVNTLNIETFTVVDAIRETALAMQKAANTLTSVAVAENTATTSQSSNAQRKRVNWNETLTTTVNQSDPIAHFFGLSDETIITSTTKLARNILRAIFTNQKLSSIEREIVSNTLTQIQKNNKTHSQKPTKQEQQQAKAEGQTQFQSAIQEAKKMITENDGTRAVTCLTDYIHAKAADAQLEGYKYQRRQGQKLNSRDKITILEKDIYPSLRVNPAISKKYEAFKDPTFAQKCGEVINCVKRQVSLDVKQERHNQQINTIISKLESQVPTDNKRDPQHNPENSCAATTEKNTSDLPPNKHKKLIIQELRKLQAIDWVEEDTIDHKEFEEYQKNANRQIKEIKSVLENQEDSTPISIGDMTTKITEILTRNERNNND